MEDKDSFWLEENFITNADEIVQLAEKEKDKFSSRAEGSVDAILTPYGYSKMFSLWKRNMSEELKAAILRTLPEEHLEIPPDDYLLNRYEPGGYLPRHIDAANKSWKFFLVFLRSDKPHLKVYNEKYPEGKLIEEKPGALFHFPLNLEHEVTLIEEGERPKYSLIYSWTL
jgi:hypothetical protein